MAPRSKQSKSTPKSKRIQDPWAVVRALEASEKVGRNKVPKGAKDDVIDAAVFGPRGASTFGSSNVDADRGGSADRATEGGGQGRKRAKKRRRAGGNRDEDASVPTHVAAKELKRPQGAVAKPMPKQIPGESVRAFAARVDVHTREQLLESRRFARTPHHRERKKAAKKADVERKAAKAAKKGSVVDDDVKPQAARAFGEVVQRPPELSATALKSRAKLKAKAAVSGGPPSDLAGYAESVREAYAALRKKRMSGDATVLQR